MKIEKPLSTERITVRDYEKTDLPVLTAMWFDEENGKYLSDPTRDYVDGPYQKALDGLAESPTGYYLTAVSNRTGGIIGSGCLFPDETGKRFDIGYCVRKDCWGKGLGTELVSLLIQLARRRGGIEVTAEVAAENTASRRLLERCGFQILRTSSFKKYNMDVCYDSYIFSLRLDGDNRVS